jgi:hypothetical protein
MSIFSELYRKLPNIHYSIGEFNETVKDITIRFKLKYNLKYTNDFFDTYYIEQFERPDQIAKKYYDDVNLAWVVLYFNNIYDIYNELPISKTDLEDYLLRKYKKEIEAQELINDVQKKIDRETVQILQSEIQTLKKEFDSYRNVIDNESFILSVLAEVDRLKYTIQMAKSVEYLKYLDSIDAFNKEKLRLKEIETRKKEQYLDLFSVYDIDQERLQSIPEIEKQLNSLISAIDSHNRAKINFENKIVNIFALNFSSFSSIPQIDYNFLYSKVQALKNYTLSNLSNFGIESGSSFNLALDNLSLSTFNDFDYSNLIGVSRYNKIKSANDNFVEVISIVNRLKIILEEMAKSFSTFNILNYSYKIDLISLSKLLLGRISSGNYNISDLVDKITQESDSHTSILDQLNKINDLCSTIKQFNIDSVVLYDWVSSYTNVNLSTINQADYKENKLSLDTTIYNLDRDNKAVVDVSKIYDENIIYKNDVLNSQERIDAYEGYILTLGELFRIETLDYKKTLIYNVNHENTTISIQNMNQEIKDKFVLLSSFGWNERILIDIDKTRKEILQKENEIFFLTTRKKYPDFLNTAKVYLDKNGHVVYVDPDNQQEIQRLLDGNEIKLISYRDHEYIMNDKKRTLYLLKPQYITALMDVLKQQVKMMEVA